MRHPLTILVAVAIVFAGACASIPYKPVYQMPEAIADEEICRQMLPTPGSIFDYGNQGAPIHQMTVALGVPSLRVVSCVQTLMPLGPVGGLYGLDYDDTPMMIIMVDPLYLSYLENRHIEGMAFQFHMQSIFAHEISHIVIGNDFQCDHVWEDQGKVRFSEALTCEHATDTLAAQVIGKDTMVETLEVVSDFVIEHGMRIRPELGQTNPVIGLQRNRLQLLRARTIVPLPVLKTP